MKRTSATLAMGLLSAPVSAARTHVITVRKTPETALRAPVVAKGVRNDHLWFDGPCVTGTGGSQILTGSPGLDVAAIGKKAVVAGRGPGGAPGCLAGRGGTARPSPETGATARRILSIAATADREDPPVSGVAGSSAAETPSL